MPRKVHINTASSEEKEPFKKRSPKYLWIYSSSNGRKMDLPLYHEINHSFFTNLIRRVWINENKRPIVRVTGSHKYSCIFGSTSMKGKQLFRQYDKFNGDTFLDYLKKIHAKFPQCYMFMDKASPHYKSKKVLKYFEENKDILIPIYLPTASPEFMVMEEVWNIAKRDLLILQYYQSFADLKNKISIYFRTKRFNLNMRNYLLSGVR
jgi:transposase